jgi:hypothetical protein
LFSGLFVKESHRRWFIRFNGDFHGEFGGFQQAFAFGF